MFIEVLVTPGKCLDSAYKQTTTASFQTVACSPFNQHLSISFVTVTSVVEMAPLNSK
jgi:hypothetical protein